MTNEEAMQIIKWSIDLQREILAHMFLDHVMNPNCAGCQAIMKQWKSPPRSLENLVRPNGENGENVVTG